MSDTDDNFICRRQNRSRAHRDAVVRMFLAQSASLMAQQPEPHEVRTRRYFIRDRELHDAIMMRDYFTGGRLTYSERNFHDRLRMKRALFLKIKDDMCEMDIEWPQGIDALGIPGHSPHMKTLACIKLLATGQSADSIDDYMRMCKITLYKYLKRFVRNIVERYKGEYLRKPNQDDINRILAENEARGFPGMLGSVDCMHKTWKNCPSSCAGYYVSYKGVPWIVLEGVVTYDMWFWHAYFGIPGSNNDLNVLNSSPLFDDIFNINAPKIDFRVDGARFDMGYYLYDGIYPRLSTIFQAYKRPTNNAQKCFTKMQEATRKDVERAFGVLQAKWHIVRGSIEYWDKEDLKYILLACVILHNMIIQDERRDGSWRTNGDEDYRVFRHTEPRQGINCHELAHEPMYNHIRERLTNHVWAKFGTNFEE